MKCIIIDDNELALKATQQCVSKVEQLTLVHVFEDALKALAYLSSNSVDLIFLDIEMPELNGIEFIKALKQPHPFIIFTTSHTEHALEAYDYNVADYLVKPIQFPRFLNAIAKVQDMYEKQNIHHTDQDTIFIKKGNLIVRVNKKDILWIEGLGDYVTLNTEKEKFIVHSTMHAIEQKFSTNDFIRVHRSFIIRIDKINNIEDNCISYFDKFIPIGKTYRETVYKRLNML
jgi:DNA-binding LytR/AlgR family response regulator